MDTALDVSLHAAILAAGPSSRFGSPKQLVRLSGAPVLHQLIANAGFVVGQSVTVLEMLLGQIFLVTLVAGLVSLWRPAAAKASSD